MESGKLCATLFQGQLGGFGNQKADGGVQTLEREEVCRLRKYDVPNVLAERSCLGPTSERYIHTSTGIRLGPAPTKTNG